MLSFSVTLCALIDVDSFHEAGYIQTKAKMIQRQRSENLWKCKRLLKYCQIL